MSGREFESQIADLYAQSARLPDEAEFLARVDSQLDRAQRLRRRVLISLAAVTQLEVNVSIRGGFEWTGELLASLLSLPGGGLVSITVIALLLLPVLTRAVIDPK